LNRLFSFFDRKIIPGLKIPKDYLVVDIGSGDKPFWRADVFVDNLKFDNYQRDSNTKVISNFGYFVNCDASKMPFKDKAFDFSYCSNLLEHVENPTLVIREITRVSKRGCIQVPNGLGENIKPFTSHLWRIYKHNEKLIFVRKAKKMTEIEINNSKNFPGLYSKIQFPFIIHRWERKIDFEIIIEPEAVYRGKPGHTPSRFSQRLSIALYIFFVKLVRIIFYKNKNIRERLTSRQGLSQTTYFTK